MLLIQTHWGWAWPFYFSAGGLLLGVALLGLVKLRSSLSALPSPTQSAGWQEWLSYFKVPSHSRWALLLVLYFPFIGAAWIYLKPLLIELRFAPQQIALVVGVGGGTVAALASLLGSHLTRRMGVGFSMPAFALALRSRAWLSSPS